MRPVLVTARDRPDLARSARRIGQAWPTFMRQAPAGAAYAAHLGALLDWTFYLLDAEDPHRLQVRVTTVPWRWERPLDALPDRGWDAAVEIGVATDPDTASEACALGVTVHPDAQGRGLSGVALRLLATELRRRDIRRLVVPVRPTGKAAQPHASLDTYLARRRPDGLSADPWVRVHERCGATAVRLAPFSVTVLGTVAQWARWTDTDFGADAASVVIPGGLVPVMIDRVEAIGAYVEPNVWMAYDLAEAAP